MYHSRRTVQQQSPQAFDKKDKRKMPEKVTLNKDLNIIEVSSYGSVASEHVTRSVSEVERLHQETGINKVLVDTTGLTSFPGTIDAYEIAKSFPRTLRIAVFILEEQKTRFDLRFTETVAQNYGIDLRLFNSKDDALEWLRA